MADTYLQGTRTRNGALEFFDKATGTTVGGFSTQNGMTALAGGGQTGATAIVAATSRFTTVATSGDSSILPSSAVGAELFVINAGAAAMNVFPASGESINALSANSAFSVSNGKSALFVCAVVGTWSTSLSA